MIKMFYFLFVLCGATLTAEVKVLAFSGSTREDSYNKKLLNVAIELAKAEGANVTLIDLRAFPIPFYDGDLEANQGMPESAKKFRQLLQENQAVLIATPEYNGSYPALLKNAIDWATRNEQGEPSRDAFQGKKFAIMSASPGQGGGKDAVLALKKLIERVGGTVVPGEVTLANSYQAFDENGALVDPSIQKQLQKEVQMLIKSK